MNSAAHFACIVSAMAADNCCHFAFTAEQAKAGESAVARLILAGLALPITEQEAAAAMNDIDSHYWQLAAGEAADMHMKYGHLDGYAALDDVLNDIFNGPLREDT